MANWSIYVAPEEEALLKKKIEEIAKKNRWSFSQAVSGILKDHLIHEKKKLPDSASWELTTAQSFFEGYSEKDSAYDVL